MTILDEMADTVGLVMLANGDDPRAVTDEAFDRAVDAIQAAVDAGRSAVHGERLRAAAREGRLVAAVAWSGDIVQLQADNPKLKWAVPKDGGMIWTDNMLIPIGGGVAKASTYMNFVYDPKIAAQDRRVRQLRARRSRGRRRCSRRATRTSRTTR